MNLFYNTSRINSNAIIEQAGTVIALLQMNEGEYLK